MREALNDTADVMRGHTAARELHVDTRCVLPRRECDRRRQLRIGRRRRIDRDRDFFNHGTGFECPPVHERPRSDLARAESPRRPDVDRRRQQTRFERSRGHAVGSWRQPEHPVFAPIVRRDRLRDGHNLLASVVDESQRQDLDATERIAVGIDHAARDPARRPHRETGGDTLSFMHIERRADTGWAALPVLNRQIAWHIRDEPVRAGLDISHQE